MAEYFLGKGYQLKIYDKNVSLSKITGTNKDYIDQHIPHLSELLVDPIEAVVEDSDLLVVTHHMEGLGALVEKYPDKHFIDLVGSAQLDNDNYEGICW